MLENRLATPPVSRFLRGHWPSGRRLRFQGREAKRGSGRMGLGGQWGRRRPARPLVVRRVVGVRPVDAHVESAAPKSASGVKGKTQGPARSDARCFPISQRFSPRLSSEGQRKVSGRGVKGLQPKSQNLEGLSHQEGLWPKGRAGGQLRHGPGGVSAPLTLGGSQSMSTVN